VAKYICDLCGEVAGKARKDLESRTGKRVVSKQNYLQLPQNRKLPSPRK
jgi:hypothetical protein